eukprot:TRINITY_DN1152_c0_g1_i3.p2 TRINITY_DN1152_c0_g1~~TRINITY_DN1152_c0_g1_i3.p2  ORF type:complete len:222 (+),score=71.42 TRINITY_DN1152_c0_g1_i3:1111-1776(+)
MGHDKSLELAEDCKTAAQKTRLTVMPQEEDMELVLLVLAIQDAAQKAGRGAEVKVNKGASDDTIAKLKDEVGTYRSRAHGKGKTQLSKVPANVENLLRHCDGVSFECSQSGCGANMPSVEDILEIHGYSDYMQEKFAGINCLPWMSIDCEMAFLVLDITSDGGPTLWLIDQECQSSTCFGTLEDVLKAVLNYYKKDGKELSLPETRGARSFPNQFWCDDDE